MAERKAELDQKDRCPRSVGAERGETSGRRATVDKMAGKLAGDNKIARVGVVALQGLGLGFQIKTKKGGEELERAKIARTIQEQNLGFWNIGFRRFSENEQEKIDGVVVVASLVAVGPSVVVAVKGAIGGGKVVVTFRVSLLKKMVLWFVVVGQLYYTKAQFPETHSSTQAEQKSPWPTQATYTNFAYFGAAGKSNERK